MDCKSGWYIHRVHPNTSPLKIWEKRECGHIQGLPKFSEYPLLSQECIKLRTSNLADIFTVSIRTQASGGALNCTQSNPLKNLGEKGAWHIQGLPKFFEYPRLSQERVKLRTSNLAGGFTASMRAKSPLKFVRKGSVGLSRDCWNLFSTPYYLRNG